MKKQLIKKLFAFILIMMFPISFLHAQCKGNKVLMYKSFRSGGCISKCVPQSQVQEYFNAGWRYSCVSSFPIGNKIPKKRLGKIPDNAMLAKK